MSTMRDQVLRRVAAALTRIVDPSGEDVLSSGRVRDLEVSDEGEVRFRFALRGDDPATLVREARTAAEAVEGVSKVRVDVGLPASRGTAPQPAAHAKSPLRPGSVPAPTPDPNVLPNVGRIIAVSSGKGGVGKSTVAANLAVALARAGRRVGVLDADVYGPNIPIMFGETRKPQVTGTKGAERIEPLEAHGVKLMSLGFLLEEGQAAVMRGPLIAGILRQFLEQVEWGELDYMVVDMPPGTGDAQLSLVQNVRVHGAVMVTTPQDVSTGDVLRGIRMFEKVDTRVLGIVENMSGFVCSSCDVEHDIFGKGGGAALAERVGVPFLGSVPLELRVREGGDAGTPIVVSQPDSRAAQALAAVARAVLTEVEAAV
jgi:ATP-binding protein involved in chromosome partitioning